MFRFQGVGLPCCLPRGWLGDESFPADPECSCGLSVAAFEFHRPGCVRSLHPYIDEQSDALVEDAVACLVWLRGSERGDAGAALSALASLIAEAQGRLPDAVADARERGETWAEIAARLASTASTVGRRYRDYTRWRASRRVREG
jgi:hypothetical protein